jgi:NAD(P)-dependent dehydrogenase (short-subunit alcohol dehydrogenase family)
MPDAAPAVTLPTALVTGAARGIGMAVAARLLDSGWSVLAGDVDAEALRASCDHLAPRGPIRARPLDVGVPDQVRAAVDAARAWTGRLDGLVNNAGIMRAGAPETLDIADWDAVLRTNLTGAFLCARTAAPLMRSPGGAIVNIASTRALMSEPDTEAYAAAKGGLVALTHALSISLGPAIRVNAISPGWIDVTGWGSPVDPLDAEALTDRDHAQHPAGRVGVPEDVAGLARWLLSSEAAFVTGANFVVDGGMTHKMIYEDT